MNFKMKILWWVGPKSVSICKNNHRILLWNNLLQIIRCITITCILFFFINLIILTGFCFIRLDTANMNDLDYTKVWLEGEFDHSREVLIGYRPNFQPDRTPKGFKANFGLLVVTPFKLKDTGCVNVHVIFSGFIALIFRYTVNAVLNCLMS